MATQAAIKADLIALAAAMKASEMSDADWADEMATIIYDAITGRETTVTGTLPDGPVAATGTVQA